MYGVGNTVAVPMWLNHLAGTLCPATITWLLRCLSYPTAFNTNTESIVGWNNKGNKG